MKLSIQLYKFYNIGESMSNSRIIQNIKNLTEKNLKKYKLATNIPEQKQKGIEYPKPIAFYYTDQKFEINNRELNIFCKIYNFGAISIKTNINQQIENIKEIYQIINEDQKKQINEIFDTIYKNIINELNINKKLNIIYDNLYPVYCLGNGETQDVKQIVENNYQTIASLLVSNSPSKNLSHQQIESIMKNKIRFYEDDYNVIHWNGSFIIENNENYSDILFIIELANIHYTKLNSYDNYINNYLDQYLSRLQKPLKSKFPFQIFKLKNRIKEIATLRIELDKMINAMDNFEKFYGNFYLAKVYNLAGSAYGIYHLKNMVQNRLEVVDNLYTMLKEQANQSKMLILSFLTFVLFILWFLGI